MAPGIQLGNSHHPCSHAPWRQVLESQKCQEVLQQSCLVFVKSSYCQKFHQGSEWIQNAQPKPLSPYFWNAAKQKKILVTVKAQPWDQRPAAMIFKFIYLYVFYIFSWIFHKQALGWQDYITEEKKNVQGVCIHTIHSLTKSFQICQHHPTMGRCFNKNW